MEQVAYGILGALAGAWIVAMLIELVQVFPWGLIVLGAVLGFGLLGIRALKVRH